MLGDFFVWALRNNLFAKSKESWLTAALFYSCSFLRNLNVLGYKSDRARKSSRQRIN